MLPSVADIDWTQLNERERDTLNAAVDADEHGLDQAAADRGIDKAMLQKRIAALGNKIKALASGPELPAMTDDGYEALRDSIAEHGQRVPILVDADGKTIDGHHRRRVCHELGLIPWAVPVEGSADQLRSLALVVNVARRHLTASARRGLVRSELLRDASRSDRAIAALVGVTHPTVAAVRAELEDVGTVERLSTRTGQDGVAQPARKPEPEPAEEELALGTVDLTLRVTRRVAQDLDGGRWLECKAVRLVLVASGVYEFEVRP